MNINDCLRSMFDNNGQFISLAETSLRLRSSGFVNRMRRVQRDELTCDEEVLQYNVRFDFIIEAPPGLSTHRRETMQRKIFGQLKTRCKGKSCPKEILLIELTFLCIRTG